MMKLDDAGAQAKLRSDKLSPAMPTVTGTTFLCELELDLLRQLTNRPGKKNHIKSLQG